KDIALMAEKIRPLGQKWLDEFASAYLALNDKQYLPEIEHKIVLAAKADSEENEQRKISADEQQKAYLQEQERLADARRAKAELWRDRVWGNRKSKIRTIIMGVMVCLLIAFIVGGFLARRGAEQSKIARTALFFEAVKHN